MSEPKPIHFNATDWKACIQWGVREGLIRFPMSTVLEPDLSPDLKEAMKLKTKAERSATNIIAPH